MMDLSGFGPKLDELTISRPIHIVGPYTPLTYCILPFGAKPDRTRSCVKSTRSLMARCAKTPLLRKLNRE
jgi:hypothetical protein